MREPEHTHDDGPITPEELDELEERAGAFVEHWTKLPPEVRATMPSGEAYWAGRCIQLAAEIRRQRNGLDLIRDDIRLLRDEVGRLIAAALHK